MLSPYAFLLPRSSTGKSAARGLLAVMIPLVLLFFGLVLYSLFAPGPVAYRKQGVAVIRTQFDALPAVGSVRPVYVREYSQDRMLVTSEFPLEVTCTEVLDHYHHVAPEHGWTYEGRDQHGSDILDYYSGSFSGYELAFVLECNSSQPNYLISISA